MYGDSRYFTLGKDIRCIGLYNIDSRDFGLTRQMQDVFLFPVIRHGQLVVQPFCNKVESMVYNEISIGATVGVASNTLYLSCLYNTVTYVFPLNNANRMSFTNSFTIIFPTGDSYFILYVEQVKDVVCGNQSGMYSYLVVID